MIDAWAGTRGRRGLLVATLTTMILGAFPSGGMAGAPDAPGAEDARPGPADDATFRPTVLIRKGNTQGSGSVITSVPGETLILTVAHAVQEPGDLLVELHRYNLGLERGADPGGWPRRVPAEVVAVDKAGDVALIRIRKMVALPFVARLADGDAEPPPGTVVTSLGIDQATHLSSWTARVYGGVDWALKREGVERPFLITDRAPEHGRSGGGLFLADGTLVGICVGRIELKDDLALGVFAPAASIHRLIRAHRDKVEAARRAAKQRAAGGP